MKTLITSFIALIISSSCLAQEVGYIKMKSFKKPIVQAEINGKKGYFLVDTGADISIINASDLKKYKLETAKIYGDHKQAIGFNGNKTCVMKVKNAEVRFESEFDHKNFYSFDITSVVRVIEAKTNLKISGILGSDWLMKYNCVIDYSQRRVIMVDSRRKKLVATK
ncbi:MAG: retropepsin-like aspartic protease [Bacteroidota bacterium]